jgi:hypothetical protein
MGRKWAARLMDTLTVHGGEEYVRHELITAALHIAQL